MLTRCPNCHTRFRLHPAQLQAAGGRVRCGQCEHLFDARNPTTAAAAPEQAAATAPSPLSATPRTSTGAVGRLFWFLGVLLLSAALALQYIWWERHRLVADPMGQRILKQLCRYAPCDVQPTRAPEQVAVLERSFTPHPDKPDALLFQLRLANRAAHAQPFPIIELRLFDSRQDLTAARRFEPRQYRDAANSHWDLMPPGEAVEIQLTLRDPGTHITGFLLDFL